MGVFREILHAVQGVWADVKKLQEMQDPNLKKKADRYEEISKYLNDISFSVSKVYAKTDDNGNTRVYVEYAPLVATIDCGDNEHEAVYDKKIVAINMLNIIPYEDMVKISHMVEKNKQK